MADYNLADKLTNVEQTSTEIPDTDLANCRRLVARHGLDMKYTPERGWFVWDGIRWIADSSWAMRRVKETAESIYDEIRHASADTQRALFNWARQSQSEKSLKAMMNLAQSEPGISANYADFDKDPWLLNCINGTVDLRTGALRKHRQEDLISKLIPIEYDPSAPCERWRIFLERVMAGSEVLIEYLQRAIGYSLTGSTGEQCLFFAYGTGANGKTVLLETIQSLLGDYSLNAPADMLMIRQRNIPNDIARLSGARFVAMNETADCERLDEARVKDMTGGDTLTARYLHREYFDFKPQFKLWIRGNHKPQIRGTDDGIWRRLQLIPFTVQIPEAERNHNLPECLKGELPGILAWAVQGCLEWQRRGLKTPDEVRCAVREYRSEMDVLGNFIDECCLIGPYRVKAKDLYDAYVEWAREYGEYPVNKKKFGLALTERGFQRERTNIAWYYVGIGLEVTDVTDRDGHYGFARDTRAYLGKNTGHMSQVSQSSPDAGNGKCAPCERTMSCMLLVGQRELCDGPFPD